MRNLFCATAILVTTFAGAATAADEWEQRRASASCQADLDSWIEHEVRGGRGLEAVLFNTGERLRGVVQWANGTYQEVIVGPRSDGLTCLLFVRDVPEGTLNVIHALGE